MKDQLVSLLDFFNKKLLRIPDYQRGYAWGEKQLVDFWNDLDNLQHDRYHYTGMLSIKKIANAKDIYPSDAWLLGAGYTAYHVVDGQQRLTTCVILINEIINCIRNNSGNKPDNEIQFCCFPLNEAVRNFISVTQFGSIPMVSYLFGYEQDNPSDKYLRYNILGENAPGTIEKTYYTNNLSKAKDFFKENLQGLYEREGKQGIESLYQKLTQKLKFNVYDIDDDYDVYMAFETMNTRGKSLSNLEILKNRLIYLSTLYTDKQCSKDEKEKLRNKINDAWKEIYARLGEDYENVLSDDTFLREHWIMYYKYTGKKGEKYISFLLDRFSEHNIFEKKQLRAVIETSEEEQEDDEFEENVTQSTITYEYASPKEYLEPAEILNYVNNLKSMVKYWCYTFIPEKRGLALGFTEEENKWIDRLKRVDISYFRPLVTVIMSKPFTSDQRIAALKAIERFIFIFFRLGASYPTKYKSEYYKKAHELLVTKDEAASEKLNEIVQDINSKLDENHINDCIKKFADKINTLFRDNDGYYSWQQLNYFMTEYEMSLADHNTITRLFSNKNNDKLSREHILPQTPSNEYWQKTYEKYSEKEIKMLTGALGNLLPLASSINSALQNDSFEDKKEI